MIFYIMTGMIEIIGIIEASTDEEYNNNNILSLKILINNSHKKQ